MKPDYVSTLQNGHARCVVSTAFAVAPVGRAFGRDPVRVRFAGDEFNKQLRHMYAQSVMGTDPGVIRASAHQLACTLWPRAEAMSTVMRVVGPLAVHAWITRVRLGRRGVWTSVCDFSWWTNMTSNQTLSNCNRG